MFRRRSGITQAVLADHVRVSQSWISQIERGHADGRLPARTLDDLAAALGVSREDLVGPDPRNKALESPATRAHAGSLPVPVRPLVGRSSTRGAIEDALLEQGTRLLTLTGPGGVGKTHLATSAAAELENAFDGTTLVLLEPCSDEGQIVAAIAHAIGLQLRDSRPLVTRVLVELGTRRRLLVLDNAEHLVEPVAKLVEKLLVECPQLVVLVTSRRPLRIPGEVVIGVDPLTLPRADQTDVAAIAASPAVRLFVERVATDGPKFSVDQDNAATVAEICRRLDGLPLAIELAAARVRTMPVDVLLERLDRRLVVLTSGARHLPVRQQTMRSAIAWSYDLLSPPEQALFRLLAVFSGGFDLDAAEAMCLETADGNDHVDAPAHDEDDRFQDALAALLDHQLVTKSDPPDGPPRFGMLETIREYGLEQLDRQSEGEAARRRHLHLCLERVERGLPTLYTADEAAELGRIEREDGNHRAALGWSLDRGSGSDLEHGLRLAAALTDAWYLRGRLAEGRSWLDKMVAASAGQPASVGRARALVGACLIANEHGDVAAARVHGANGRAMAEALGDEPTIARALALTGNLAIPSGDLDGADAAHRAALTIFQRLDNRPWVAVETVNLALIAYKRGRFEEAAAEARIALDLAREIGDDVDTGLALGILGDVARELNDLEGAEGFYAEQLAIARRRGTHTEIGNVLSGLGGLAADRGQFEPAARLLGAAEGLYRRVGLRIPPPCRPDWQSSVALVREHLPPDRFAHAWKTAPDEAIASVLSA